MKTPVTLRLVEEIAHFGLRYTCDHCLHFADAMEDGSDSELANRCTLGWPEGERLRQLTPGEVVAFCKDFEP